MDRYFKGGFTLTELVLIVVFLGIMAVIAIPRMNYSAVNSQKADLTAQKIVTDLRRTCSLAIANSANNSSGFELKMTGSAPYGGYEIIDLSDNSTVDAHTISSGVNCSGGDEFKFSPGGYLLNGSDNTLTISSDEGKSFTITIVPGTGMVKCVEN